MILRLLAVAGLLLLYDSGFSQNDGRKIKVLKVFSGLNLTNRSPEIFITSTDYDQKSFDLLQSISLALSSDKHFHEIEVSSIQISKTKDEEVRDGLLVRGAETNKTVLKARYSFNSFIQKSEKQRISIGAALTPYLSRVRTDPLVLSSFERIATSYGVSLEVIPRIILDLNDRLILEMNISTVFVNWNQDKHRISNPAIPVEQQKNKETSTNFFPGVHQASLGLGIKL